MDDKLNILLATVRAYLILAKNPNSSTYYIHKAHSTLQLAEKLKAESSSIKAAA